MEQIQNSITIDGTCYSLSALTFNDIRCKYGTGRSITNRKGERASYRTGMMTNIGDIEESEWMRIAAQLISQAGEQALYANLLEWISDEVPWVAGKKATEKHALLLHVDRIFDDPTWVGYVGFNAKYRPEVLAKCRELVLIVSDCCQEEGYVTAEQIRRSKSVDGRVSCPCCGKFTHYKIIKRGAKYVH